jgi:predicted ester cyclase
MHSLLLSLCAVGGKARDKTDPREVNKRIVRGYLRIIEQPDFADWDAFFREEVTFNGESLPPRSLSGILDYFREGFPDLSFTPKGQIAEDDRVATWGVFEGTHEGDFNGISPTGKRVKWFGMAIDRIEDGKVVEMLHEMDTWGLMEQIRSDAE